VSAGGTGGGSEIEQEHRSAPATTVTGRDGSNEAPSSSTGVRRDSGESSHDGGIESGSGGTGSGDSRDRGATGESGHDGGSGPGD
jgi:hypothetical protein